LTALFKKIKNSLTQPFANLGPTCGAAIMAARNCTGEDGKQVPRSGRVIPNQEVISDLACRIETAYRLRFSRWLGGCSTARVWDQAALYLWQAHENAPERTPLDAELYVASQKVSGGFANPWLDVAHPDAVARYRLRVDEIVGQLKVELEQEIVWAERAISRGRAIRKVLKPRKGRLTHLGCYITALRADRADLAERFASGAALQHQACPLYRAASSALIAAEDYPFDRFPLALRAGRSRAQMLLPTLN
jgi:hypothetical protein